MAVFVIGDLHLSQNGTKPMDIFPGWENHRERLQYNWERRVSNHDTVILAGDSSWAMTFEQAMPDFLWLDSLPGKKILLKGNHDYWWSSLTSMNNALNTAGVSSISFLHNNSYFADGINICGSRGWLFESGQEQDAKIIRREAIRIEASLKSVQNSAAPTALFLHYPPVYADQEISAFLELMRSYGIDCCYYGHIHGAGCRGAVQGMLRGIHLRLVSADYTEFDLVPV